MVWRRKWMILLPTLAVSVAVAYVVWKLPNVYESTTLLTVRPAAITSNIVPQLSDDDLTIRINTIGQEVTSRSNLEPLIERYGLYAAERRRGESMDDLIDRMRTRDIKVTLNTTRNEVTNGFYLSFRGPEPRVTQAVAEVLASKYVSAQTQNASQEARLTKEFFDNKLREDKEALDDILKRRLEFMMSNINSLPSDAQARVGQLAGLREEQKTRITEIGRINDQIAANNKFIADLAKANAQAVEELVAQMQDPKSTSAYAELVKSQTALKAERENLKVIFKEAAPEMKANQKQIDEIQRQMDVMVEEHKQKVEDLRKRLENKVDPRLTSYKGEISRLEGEVKRQQSLLSQTEAQIAAISQQLSGVPSSTVGLEAINREYESAKAVYESTLTQQQKAVIAADVTGSQQGQSIMVLDPASLPEQSVAPKRIMLMLMGLVGGFGLGVVLAAAFELPRLLTIQTTEDAAHYTGLPVLVTLPTLRTANEERNMKVRRMALAAACLAATILSAPTLAFILTRLHIIEEIAAR
jgi:polysaccharide biosynthesis transport protein